MNTQKGMDVEEVRRMATQLRDAGEEIATIERELTSGLEEVFWEGPDADQFRGEWTGEMVPALQKVRDAVSALGDDADRNASDQESVSSS